MFASTKSKILWSAVVSGLLLSSVVVTAQTPVRLDPLPVGLQPLGVDMTVVSTAQAYAAVANSGDNSVSILSVSFGNPRTITQLSTVTGIPSPYAVVACPGTPIQMLVTSPSDNTVRVLSLPGGAVSGPVKVGPQPYSASCFAGSTGKLQGVVSNLGDNTLVVFDIDHPHDHCYDYWSAGQPRPTWDRNR
jgi:hypothetical protein